MHAKICAYIRNEEQQAVYDDINANADEKLVQLS